LWIEKYKILTVGDNGVGKTSFVVKWGGDVENPQNVDSRSKKLTIDNKHIDCILWDTGGMERFRNITITYYRGAQAVILFYDLTNKDSFENLNVWFGDSERYTNGQAQLFVVGNKLDLEGERMIKEEEITEFCESKNIKHFEASAKTGENVENIINMICSTILEKEKEEDD